MVGRGVPQGRTVEAVQQGANGGAGAVRVRGVHQAVQCFALGAARVLAKCMELSEIHSELIRDMEVAASMGDAPYFNDLERQAREAAAKARECLDAMPEIR